MSPSRPRILVARLDNAGDVLLTGPLVRAAAVTGRVVLLCSPTGEPAARLLPGVAEVVVARAGWIEADGPPVTAASAGELVERLAALELDEAVLPTSFHQSPLPLALLLRMAGVPRIGAISVDFPGTLLDVRHLVPDDVHEVERSLSLGAALGHHLPPGDDGRLAVRTTGPLPAEVAALDRPYVVVHPGASVPARAWSEASHARLVGELAAGGRSVVVTGSAGERALTRSVAGDTATDLGGRTDLAGLAAVLAGAAAVVVGNTGPAHLAAAVGTPVVSLYAPTVPAVRWRPWMVPHVLLGDQEIACAGCRARRCPVPGHPCVEGIAVEDVVAAVEHLAAGRPVAGRIPS